jgi:hypothetical protein
VPRSGSGGGWDRRGGGSSSGLIPAARGESALAPRIGGSGLAHAPRRGKRLVGPPSAPSAASASSSRPPRSAGDARSSSSGSDAAAASTSSPAIGSSPKFITPSLLKSMCTRPASELHSG